MKKIDKPNLFIVGAAKAGTTSIYHYLKANPAVFMSPIKEPNFFGSDITWEQFTGNYSKNTYLDTKKYFSNEKLTDRHIAFLDNEDDYLKLFRNTEKYFYRGEASTSYLYSKRAAREIYTFDPLSKIIIILREPIDRTLSHYFMDYSGQNEGERNILRALQKDYYAKRKGWGISRLYIEMSLYYEQVKRYLDVFPREQILIINYEDLKKDKDKVIRDLFCFLGIEYEMENMAKSKIYNQTYIPKFNLIKKFFWLKNFVPNSFKKHIKQKANFLFAEKGQMTVPPEVEQFIAELVLDDWRKTKELLLT